MHLCRLLPRRNILVLVHALDTEPVKSRGLLTVVLLAGFLLTSRRFASGSQVAS